MNYSLRFRRSLSLLSTTLWLIISSLSANAQTFTIVHNFGAPNDGAFPSGHLLRDSMDNLYGASLGGSLGWGTVFKIEPSGHEHVLYNFQDGADGLIPSISFLESDNIIGTTYQGGVNLFGTVFTLNPEGKLTNLFSCCSPPSGIGAFPGGAIKDLDRDLYVAAFAGGDGNCYLTGCGTIFKLDSRNTAILVHTFGEVVGDGEFPNPSLIRDAAGNLYGTTTYGGASGWGTIFKIGPGGNETILYSFLGGTDGSSPTDGLYRDPQGDFYGTTAGGGSHNFGTVFKVTSLDEHLVLFNFNGSDGAQPIGGVLLDGKGNIYGVTYTGGSHNKGTIFQLSPKGDLTVLHEFSGELDGEYPESVLLVNGAFYGVTYQGGVYNLGTVFKLVPCASNS